MYMVPPFLAYYGVMSHNTSLLEEAYTQLKLYRNYLASDSSAALRHVVLGDWQDNGLWATGNGWAAAGELSSWCSFLTVDSSSCFSKV
jgi:rhamnogalacturonyl hydrolase YesR